MIFSSSESTPINDLPEDADITDKFKYIQNIDMSIPFPAMPDFCNHPNLKSAKALLNAYDIPYPLASNIAKLKKDTRIKKNKTQADTSAQKGSAPFPNNRIFKELLLLDTLHDLQNSNPLVVYEVFKREIGKTNIPKELKQSFLASKHSFTQDAIKYIKSQHPMSALITSEVHVGLNKQNDFELQKRLGNITELNFVLDNIIAGVHENNDMADGTIGILGCAFILVLLANMKRLEMIKCEIDVTTRTIRREIKLYDGLFMQMDGVYMKRFIILFLKAAKRLSGVDYVYFFASTRVKQEYINSDINSNPSKNIISYPHSKEHFANLIVANQNNQDLWYLNFLRDAFKADVAVENNYVFMTHDRLAFLYYKLIGGTIGFLLAIDKKENDTVYSVSF